MNVGLSLQEACQPALRCQSLLSGTHEEGMQRLLQHLQHTIAFDKTPHPTVPMTPVGKRV